MPELVSANPSDVIFESHLVANAGTTREKQSIGSRVTCGRPIAYNLLELYAAKEETLPANIRLELETYDFWLIRMVCTLHEKRGSSIADMRFKVDFIYESPSDADILLNHGIKDVSLPETVVGDMPMAYDLSPADVKDETAVTATSTITANFSFGDIGTELGKDEVTLNYKQHKPRITAFGKHESHIYWRFRPGNARAVETGIKEMDAIIRKHRDAPVKGQIHVEGRGRQWGIFRTTATYRGHEFYF